jgi:hypothetical protein
MCQPRTRSWSGIGGRALRDTWQPRTRPHQGVGPGVAGHMVALGLALVKQATPAIVDSVFTLGLSRYLGVPVPCGTNSISCGTLLIFVKLL